jgi:hypothetical protein
VNFTVFCILRLLRQEIRSASDVEHKIAGSDTCIILGTNAPDEKPGSKFLKANGKQNILMV